MGTTFKLACNHKNVSEVHIITEDHPNKGFSLKLILADPISDHDIYSMFENQLNTGTTIFNKEYKTIQINQPKFDKFDDSLKKWMLNLEEIFKATKFEATKPEVINSNMLYQFISPIKIFSQPLGQFGLFRINLHFNDG